MAGALAWRVSTVRSCSRGLLAAGEQVELVLQGRLALASRASRSLERARASAGAPASSLTRTTLASSAVESFGPGRRAQGTRSSTGAADPAVPS